MPLSRGSDGKLGVKSMGGGGDVSISQTFVIDGNGNASAEQSAATGDQAVKQFASSMKSAAQAEIVSALRPGGMLWRRVNE